MREYQKHEDLGAAPHLIPLAPIEGNAFVASNRVCERIEEVTSSKHRERMSSPVSMAPRKPYCLDAHTQRAAEVGRFRGEVAGLAMGAAGARTDSTLSHALLAARLFAQIKGGEPS